MFSSTVARGKPSRCAIRGTSGSASVYVPCAAPRRMRPWRGPRLCRQGSPGRHRAEVVAVLAEEEEGAVEAVGCDGGGMTGGALLLDVGEHPVEVGRRRETRVVVQGLEGREPARRTGARASGRQGRVLDALLGRAGAAVLDCSCGIGTRAVGLALRGHEVTGTDLSPRAAREAALREVPLRTAAAGLRRLPFAKARFDAVVCADNSLPRLLTARDVDTALTETRRVLCPGGRLLLSTRPYDDLLRDRPASTPPQVHRATGGAERTVSFQHWHWHEDGEDYDRDRLTALVTDAGFLAPGWRTPEESGFQPLLTARAAP